MSNCATQASMRRTRGGTAQRVCPLVLCECRRPMAAQVHVEFWSPPEKTLKILPARRRFHSLPAIVIIEIDIDGFGLRGEISKKKSSL